MNSTHCHSPNSFGYSSEVAGSDFYVFSPNCLTKKLFW